MMSHEEARARIKELSAQQMSVLLRRIKQPVSGTKDALVVRLIDAMEDDVVDERTIRKIVTTWANPRAARATA